MGTVHTTTRTDSLWPPSTARIDRDPQTRHLWAMTRSSSTMVDFYRSTTNGSSWSLQTQLEVIGLQELGSIWIDVFGNLHMVFRSSDGSTDRIGYRRLKLTDLTFEALLVAAVANGGVAGSVYTGMDLAVVRYGTGALTAIAVGTKSGSTMGVTMFVVGGAATSPPWLNNALIAGRRQWMTTSTTGRLTPALDLQHATNPKLGDGHHLWLAFGRARLGLVRLAWNGLGWVGPTSERTIYSSKTAWDYTVARYTGNEFVMAIYDNTTVRLIERNKSDSSHVVRNTPAHPQGAIRSFAINYNSNTRDVRVFAVGTSNSRLYYVDFERASATWSSWVDLSGATLVNSGMGAAHGPDSFTVRRGTYLDTKHELVIGLSGSPNTNTSFHSSLSFAPVASWNNQTSPAGLSSGQGADVNSALVLDWIFTDLDDTDSQTAFALQRQIGAGAAQYFRASDSTWQATEQKNGSVGTPNSTTQVTLASGWGNDTDADHTYKVKVWDTADVASAYSIGLTLTPSVKSNPTLTSPTSGQVLTASTLTVTWTVGSQSAYRVKITQGGATVHDTKFRSGSATTYTPPVAFQNGLAYTVMVQTKNSEGLASNEVSNNITVDFVEPPVVRPVLTPLPAEGKMRVQLSADPPVSTQPEIESVDLYRRPVRYNNQLVNPGFDVDDSGWTDIDGSGVFTTADSRAGGGSVLFTPSGSGTLARIQPTATSLSPIDPDHPIVHVAAWQKPNTANGKPIFIRIRLTDSTNGLITTRGYRETAAVPGAWQYIETWADVTDLEGATGYTISTGRANTPTAADTFYIDETWTSFYNDDPGELIAAGLTTPINSLSVSDFFNRTSASGWGGIWTSENVGGGGAGDHTVDGDNAIQVSTAANVYRYDHTDLGANDGMVTVLFRIPALPVGASASVIIMGRMTDTLNYWHAAASIATNGVVSLSIRNRINNVLGSAIASNSNVGTISTGQYWKLGFRWSGNSFRAQAHSDVEDDTWQIFGTSSDLPTGTRAGVGSRLETGGTSLPYQVDFDTFRGYQVIGKTIGDWSVPGGIDHEYRAIAYGTNGTVIAGPWTR